MDEKKFSRPMLDRVARQHGIDPDDRRLILELAALGLVNIAWRNSPLEDWHADRHTQLDDGDMLRTNAQSSALVSEVLFEACGPDDPCIPADVDELSVVLAEVYDTLFDPERVLPDGRTLAELADHRLPDLQEHGDRALGGVLGLAEREGIETALLYVATHAALACSRWWGTPWWSAVVEEFVRRLDTPTDSHWGDDGKLWPKRTPPPDVVDRAQLRELLLNRPYDLSHDAAAYYVSAGLGYVTEPITDWRARHSLSAEDETGDPTAFRRIATAASTAPDNETRKT